MTTETLLRCTACTVEKPSTEFYGNKSRPTGHSNLCKACQRSYASNYRGQHSKEQAVLARRWIDANPEKYRAHRLVRQEIAMGRMIRPSNCGGCGQTTKIHAHHEDYTKPLEVRWLCALCHKEAHRG